MPTDTIDHADPIDADPTEPADPADPAAGPTDRPRRWTSWLLGAVSGLIAGAVGLGVAEIVAAASTSLQSPVLDVGDRVVDGVPNSVKELAIEWFGTNDKIALLVGIGALLTVYAIVLGLVLQTKRWVWAIAGTAVFGLVGAYASQSTRRDAPWYGIVPSIAGAIAAAIALALLRPRPPSGTDGAGVDGDVDAAGASGGRRSFLVTAGGLTGLALLTGFTGRWLSGRNGVGAQRGSLDLPPPGDPLAAAPTDVALDVEGIQPFFTPNADFYRIDTALTVPQVSVNDWKLRITGMVDEPIELSFAELLEREVVEADITLTCVSNEIGGRLLGTARWLGVRLDDLLAEASPTADADQIVGRSVDGYTCGFPLAALDGRDALVAIGMNGEPLPLEHGYPARLIVPGLYGYVSATKWLEEIELTRFDRFDQYWVERGWVEDAPIKTQSRIDTPRGLSSVAAGTVAIAGTAWAQTRGIDKVELRIDEGEWVEAELAAELNDVTWRQWSYAWDATPGRHSITVRATDRTGAIQTDERSEPFPSGATGQHQIVVLVG
jgi:DMSO/TMAO reductase YedYZ molybdopterin-dependent catalytic subunit